MSKLHNYNKISLSPIGANLLWETNQIDKSPLEQDNVEHIKYN